MIWTLFCLILISFVMCIFFRSGIVKLEEEVTAISNIVNNLLKRVSSIEGKKSFEKQDIDNWVNQQKEHARRLNKLEKK